MAQKHLKELLKEDQEPFYLKDYIANKQCLLKKKQATNYNTSTKIQLKKQKPTSIFCKNACFLSLQDSPDLRKSPKLFDFPPSPVPNKSPNRVFLHVPAKTAALLLDAAIRIQKQKSKPKTNHIKNSPGFGLFGSMLKRLTLRNRTQKLKMENERNKGKEVNNVNLENVVVASISSSVSSSSSYCNGRSSSLDLDSSISGRSFDDENDEDFQFTNVLKQNNDIISNNNNNNNNNKDNNIRDYYSPICLSPFRFALPKSPSPGRCSSAKSPVRCKYEDNVNYKRENKMNFQEEEDEEDKEQNSPVSVLDPPFEDDYDGHEEDNVDIECTYDFVHRAQQELLHKLHRFEKLAELDPIELEKRMIEAEEEYELEQAKELEEYDCESYTFDEEVKAHEFMQEVIRKSGFEDAKKPGIKRLISDLIAEEENSSDEHVIKRICNRLESWKDVESNTIDMMVGMDLRRDISDWKKSRKEIDETAVDIELAIFAVLVDELVQDLA